MSRAPGVIVNGRRVNPYESPSLQVTSFSPSGFWESNVLQMESINSRSRNDPSMSRLGATDTCTWTLGMTLRLAEDYNNQDTLATMDRITVSINQRDTEVGMIRLGIFTRVEGECGFFSFDSLCHQAVFGTWDAHGTHIIEIMGRLIRGIHDGNTIPSFLLAKSALQEALRTIDTTIAHGAVPVSPAKPLIEAWHQHVREVRQPQFQTARGLLEQADQHVQQLSRDLSARGVPIANVRRDLAIVYDRLFQLRFIVQAYIQGAWE